ncbi:MAG: peptidoglycan DD-metalloendopeptidase family protein [Pseudomonadaceae bacterium]|nr:peptidoglycan DD-metalloendopeptidase family protein [Pseudomonadaceae bacterium]
MKVWTMVAVAAVVAGCASQRPAPVIGGYGQVTDQQMAGAQAFDTIEPAAGPQPQLTYNTTPKSVTTAKIMVPTSAPEVSLPPPSIIGDLTEGKSKAKGWHSYTVQRGDTAYRLARQFDTSTPAILAANKLDNVTQIKEGMHLMIPAGAGRFATPETVNAKMAALGTHTPAAVEEAAVGPEVAAVEPVVTKTTVVTGPSGTRYSLTNKTVVASQPAPQLAAANVADIEPAAGPKARDVSRVMKVDGSVAEGTTYSVMPGDTVYRIASRYGVSVLDIMNVNDLENPQDLKAGTRLTIPVAGATPKAAGSKVVKSSPPNLSAYKGKIDAEAARSKGLAWPVKGKVVKSYGSEGAGVNNTGISIKTPANSPVVAADGGTVVFAGNSLKTYGNLVLIRHSNGVVTAYAHNNALLVTKGEKVKKGQTIALSGNTGNVKEPQLHFEVRKNARAVNPLSMLQ